MKISVITPSIRPAGLATVQACLEQQTFKDFEWLVELGLPGKSDLNAAYNHMIRRARGELLVFYQDCIRIGNDGLERFWKAYEADHDAFLTAAVNGDWRSQESNHGPRESFMDWEIDWGACSREAMFRIGGFDETLDEHWGFDNVNAGLRAQLAGYRIVCVDNPAAGIPHDDAPMKKRRNPDYHNYRLQQIRQGLKMDYLAP